MVASLLFCTNNWVIPAFKHYIVLFLFFFGLVLHWMMVTEHEVEDGMRRRYSFS